MPLTHYALPRFYDGLEHLHGFDQVGEGGVDIVAETICVEPGEPEGQFVIAPQGTFTIGDAFAKKLLSLRKFEVVVQCDSEIEGRSMGRQRVSRLGCEYWVLLVSYSR